MIGLIAGGIGIGTKALPNATPRNEALEAAIREAKDAGACGVYADLHE